MHATNLVGVADPSGRPAIEHGSRVKVRLQHPGGWWVDRVPAWVRWATVETGKMGAKYDGIHWDPPQGQRHELCARCPDALPNLVLCPGVVSCRTHRRPYTPAGRRYLAGSQARP